MKRQIARTACAVYLSILAPVILPVTVISVCTVSSVCALEDFEDNESFFEDICDNEEILEELEEEQRTHTSWYERAGKTCLLFCAGVYTRVSEALRALYRQD